MNEQCIVIFLAIVCTCLVAAFLEYSATTAKREGDKAKGLTNNSEFGKDKRLTNSQQSLYDHNSITRRHLCNKEE